MNLLLSGDSRVTGGSILALGLSSLGTGWGRLGESTLTGSWSMKCDMGGGPSSGESVESFASDWRARICSALHIVSIVLLLCDSEKD